MANKKIVKITKEKLDKDNRRVDNFVCDLSELLIKHGLRFEREIIILDAKTYNELSTIEIEIPEIMFGGI